MRCGVTLIAIFYTAITLYGVFTGNPILVMLALCVLSPMAFMAVWSENRELRTINLWIQRIIFIMLIWVLTAFVVAIDNFGLTPALCLRDQEEGPNALF